MQHEHFMGQALSLAQEALTAGDFPVGCVIVQGSNVVARGRRMNSHESLQEKASELDHAEIVALRNLLSESPNIDTNELVVYSTMEPCLMCYSTLLVNGIRSFVYAYEDVMGGGTNLPLTALSPLYSGIQVEISRHILRDQSLNLFKDFFTSNNYLKNTLLAEYTLNQ